MHNGWKGEQMLICGKTYPELSSRYYKVVCMMVLWEKMN
jgi:hypothetical protein